MTHVIALSSHRMQTILVAFILINFSHVATHSIAQETRRAELTLDQLYDGATVAMKAIHAISVDYKYTAKVVGGTPPSPSNVATGEWDNHFKFKSEKRFSLAKSLGKESINQTPDQTYIFDGKSGYAYRPGQLLVFDGKAPNSDNSDFYCEEVVGIPLTDLARANVDNAASFPYSARPDGHRSGFVVHPNLEQVGTAWCHVVEFPGRLKVWIDPEHGFCQRRKEVYNGGDEPIASYSFSDFREVASGVWLPWNCTRLSSPFEIKTLKLEVKTEVSDLRISEAVHDSDFSIDIPPGTMVLGMGRGFILRGDSSKLLDVFARDLPPSKDAPRRLRGQSWWLVTINVVALAAFAIYLFLKRSGLKQKADPHLT